MSFRGNKEEFKCIYTAQAESMEQGHLEIGGCDTTQLAKQYGTPLYVYDEESIRGKCRAFHRAFKESGFSYQVAYASKAFLCMEMCQ